ncbi:MAG: cytochrome c oxidase subunit II [Bdellovibrionales bacterium]|nr:cytochrome c oxidase subunit II [Bdellovibrionales bacterium]
MWWIPAAAAQTFMPPAATDIAKRVNSIYEFLVISSLISFVIVIVGLVYFIQKYKRKSENDKTAYITHNYTLEFLWSFIPFVLFMVLFAWGAKVYWDMRVSPEDAMEIHVNAKKWDWEFIYKNGRKITSDVDDKGKRIPPTMVVPVNKPVKLIMTSIKLNPNDKRDRAVLHSFFVPAFRTKQDIVPGRYTALYFTPTKVGNFHVFCTEYCGTGHSQMLGMVKVVEDNDFNNWVLGSEGGGPKELSMADKGKQIYATRACIGCHSLDGTPMTGPTWKGLYGSDRQFNDGTSTTADENYLRESILNANAKIVKGFTANQMPSFQGQLTDEDVTNVIEFIKSVK